MRHRLRWIALLCCASAPEIPALAETLPGYEAASWYGIVVPTRTPAPVIAKLRDGTEEWGKLVREIESQKK